MTIFYIILHNSTQFLVTLTLPAFYFEAHYGRFFITGSWRAKTRKWKFSAKGWKMDVRRLKTKITAGFKMRGLMLRPYVSILNNIYLQCQGVTCSQFTAFEMKLNYYNTVGSAKKPARWLYNIWWFRTLLYLSSSYAMQLLVH